VLAAHSDVRAGQTYRDGTIPYQRFRAWELSGRTAGIVGFGAVGRALAWRLQGLGMKVVAYDPYADAETVGLDELLERSDVVSMHAPVTPETTAMMGPDQFAAMKEGSFYLNTARAKLHDTDALVKALASGHLAGAGLDHFEGENLPADHPLVSMTNVVLTPHIGGATWDTEARQAAMVADDLARLQAGEKLQYAVNPEVIG
jgi:D-3-phosphoglycerate dehydrogenase